MDGAGSMSKEQSQNGDRQSLLVAKIVAMVVLVVITVLCGSLPYVLNRCFQWTKQSPEETRSSAVVRCLLFFGGGVLICTTFLHMLPEVIEVVEALQQCGSLAQTPFALTEMLLCTGFFLMYALDELMTNLVRRHQRKLSRKESVASLAFERGRSIRHSVLLKNEEKATPPQQEVKELEPQPPKDHHGHSHMPVPSGEGSGSSARGLGIILALSLHELFEGMAIGLEGTVSTVWFMFGAVAAHKLVLAFCVGMELLVARTRSPGHRVPGDLLHCDANWHRRGPGHQPAGGGWSAQSALRNPPGHRLRHPAVCGLLRDPHREPRRMASSYRRRGRILPDVWPANIVRRSGGR